MSRPASTMSAAIARGARVDSDRLVLLALAAVVGIPLIVFVAYPLLTILAKSLIQPDGAWGMANYLKAFSQNRFWQVVRNSFAVSVTVTAIAVPMALCLAYAVHRSSMSVKWLWRTIVMIPVFAPSLVQALGLIFLLGRNGLISRTFGLDINIYGFWGIVIADVIYALPQAFLVLSAALAVADARPYEAAQVLGAGKPRIFFTVTLPSIKYGLLSAIFLVFTVAITDFGNAMVIGGDYSVLANEIYNQVSGQMNFNLGSVIAIVLLFPVAIAFVAERIANKHQFAQITDRAQPLVPRRSPLFDRSMLALTAFLCAPILLVTVIVVFGSFVKLWPYNMTLTFKHYFIDSQNGYAPLWTSLWVSLVAGVAGTVLAVATAYVVQNLQNAFTRFLNVLAILPAAVPGMVLGLAYVFAFNDPDNPLYLIYGTVLILAICNVYHYYTQGFLTATTSLKQISSSFAEASSCLGASLVVTLRRVVLPMMVPTILAVAVFFFMRSMVTLSAAIFLVSPSVNLAAVSVMTLEDAGYTSQAAAFSTCIMAIVIAALLALKAVMRLRKAGSGSLIS